MILLIGCRNRATQIRTHVIEIDMKQEETIAGFKIVQTKDFGDPDASRPETLSIEVETRILRTMGDSDFQAKVQLSETE